MWLRITILLLLILPQGCARKDPAVESLVGSEPQRLSFGSPPDVQHTFVQKMKTCWFGNAKTPFAGFRYEVGERQDGQSGEIIQDVRIFDSGGDAPVFEIQFHKYNENTLIVTRNVSLGTTLLNKAQRDIQLWALTGPDCAS